MIKEALIVQNSLATFIATANWIREFEKNTQTKAAKNLRNKVKIQEPTIQETLAPAVSIASAMTQSPLCVLRAAYALP